MALVILVRHGQTDENVSGKISGQGPAPLNARGKEQAQAAADVLTALGASRILTSPIVRARQTADILAERLQVDIEEIRDLREVEYGDWEGQYFRDVRSHPMAHLVFNDPIKAVFPNGESLRDVQQRGVPVQSDWYDTDRQTRMSAVRSRGRGPRHSMHAARSRRRPPQTS